MRTSLTWLSMPDRGGVEPTEAIRQGSPDTAVIWSTVYGCHSMSSDVARLDFHRCYDNPREVDGILQVARDALGNGAVHDKGQG